MAEKKVYSSSGSKSRSAEKNKANASTEKESHTDSKVEKQQRFRSIVGILLILSSFYLTLSFFSYLFSWKLDQYRVVNKGLFEFLFEHNDIEVANWLGKFGAWMSHLFLFRWFGISSFGFCFLLLLSGTRIALSINLLPILKTYGVTFIFIVWSSIFLGFFADSVNYLGGAFGYKINEWLTLTFGSFGSFVLIIVFCYFSLLTVVNPDLSKLFRRFTYFFIDKENTKHSKHNDPLDVTIVNPITDKEKKKEQIRNAVIFDKDETKDQEEEKIPFVVEESNKDDDFEITVNEEVPEAKTVKNNFSVELPDDDTSDINEQLRKEFGNYDPTLDLSSYVLPPLDLLNDYGGHTISVNKSELEANKDKIVETLSHYKIEIAKIKATVGPTVTLYEIVPAPGIRISKIKNLEDDIALSLAALGIRIIAPIPGKGTIGIEVPNSKPDIVSMRTLIASEKFQNFDAELPIVLGKTITNETYTFDLTKMPHLLVAGATGQGKSVGLNAILVSLLYKKHPAQVKFVLIDPKKVELTLYNKIERHFLAKLPGEEEAIITDTSKVVNTLNSLCIEMEQRYELLKDAQCRTIKEYNAKFIHRKLNPETGHRFLPYIVVLIDEFADLIMTAGKEVEHPIARIAQLARAVGIHLIVATQRPSAKVITGLIKANFPARISFRVLSKVDSHIILDASGADQLIGRGDMLIATNSDLVRLQCGLVDTPEVEQICDFIGQQRAYPDALLLPEYVSEGTEDANEFDSSDLDVMFAEAARIVVTNQQGSASILQRKLKLGYNRAGRIVDQLEHIGILGPFQGSKAREVLFSDLVALEEYLKSKGIA